ncbi:hypothetical protein HU200_002099 [Digitaria exilis]|uniref:FLZ-type domain-containing protein n=1 Tax=Digitaria exilis TaxID=1010633 RepID=A0A835FZZ2_9POAL|nr:hypothetical protein HU200_002099 [Digitaria exilis]CAB3448088.1 unnamed protein product [Digitaria exilis]CAB3504543.1 unnamed protein product [Digitaria exilis]CAB3504548.1 unnamed protein product [Digitaria exilis]
MEPAERKALGKRGRSRVLPRTPSMVTVASAAKQVRQERGAGVPSSSSLPAGGAGMGAGGGRAAPRGYYSGGFLAGAETTAAFLKACGLCNRRLGPGHDTFIYRGEAAFCSHECREKQIEYDERMEQSCSSASGASGSDQSGSGGDQTVAAA